MGLLTTETDALKSCKTCDKPIGYNAFICPHCGALGRGSKAFRWFIGLGVLWLILTFIGSILIACAWFVGVGMVGRALMR